MEVLRGIDQWEFDIFELTEVTDGKLICAPLLLALKCRRRFYHSTYPGRPLYYLALHIWEKYNFRNLFNVDDAVLRKFLTKIEAGYKVRVSKEIVLFLVCPC